jgi:hypothetical protein
MTIKILNLHAIKIKRNFKKNEKRIIKEENRRN